MSAPHSPIVEDRSPYDAHYSDVPDLDRSFSNLGFHSRPGSIRTHSSVPSAGPGKDYVFYQFKRSQDGWYGAERNEIPASQSDLKKRAGKTSKSGTPLDQLRSMSVERRDEIQALLATLNAREEDGSSWEPVFLETQSEAKTYDNKRRVKAFDIILRRRKAKTERPSAPKRWESAVSAKSNQSAKSNTGAKARPKPEVHGASDMGTRPRESGFRSNDPFDSVPLFAADGQPADTRGAIPFDNAGLSPNIAQERPIGQAPPKAEDSKNKGNEKEKGSKQRAIRGREDDFLAIENGSDDGLVIIDDEDNHGRPVNRHNSGVRRRHYEPRYYQNGDRYYSDRSSWGSDQGSALFAEVDELSSMTSDETRGSHGRGESKVVHTGKTRGGNLVRRYSRGGERIILPERRVSHRRQYSHEEDRQLGIEQPLPRHTPRHSTVIHQTREHSARPEPYRQERIPYDSYGRDSVPPEVPMAPHYKEHDYQERRADDYMRDKAREEQAIRDEQAYDARGSRQTDYIPREVDYYTGRQGTRRYNWEPRDLRR